MKKQYVVNITYLVSYSAAGIILCTKLYIPSGTTVCIS